MEPGSLVGNCRIVEKIDQGGMGTVYRAVQLSVGREVVVKLLAAEWVSDAEFVRRFVQEAVAAARLNHPNIVQVHDQGEHEGRPYIVMEYVPGASVAGLIQQHGVIGVPRAIELLIQCAAALAAAHDAGIVHRDIKPGNLLVTPAGQLKLTDFGIAKVFGDDATRLTRTDCLIGTLQYMAPELFEGGQASPASDVYSLGITLYHMLSGTRPFEERNTLKLVSKHLHEQPVPLVQRNALIPEELSKLVQKMIAKRPASRFTSCHALEQDARKLQSRLGLERRESNGLPTELSVLRGRPAAFRRLAPWIVCGVLLLLSAVLGWWLSTRIG